ncbi:hypothetical protein [Burkholderia diffusa]|uniref:hypothetical protein n=1 Tax=Burkholderia diffusa TaxID=488732 RepID=UPI001581A8F5|nr:hypothetical protein [Burkholderia diffusa]
MSPHLIPDGTADGITRRLAAAITYSEPARDPSAIAAARRGLLDFLRAAFAGARDNGYRKLLAACGRDSVGSAAVIGSAEPASPQHAARGAAFNLGGPSHSAAATGCRS